MKTIKKYTMSLVASALLATTSLTAGNVSEDEFNEALSEIEEQIAVLETRSLLNSKIQFGMAFETTFENQDVTMGDGSSYSQDNIWRTYVDINMNSKINDSLQFNGSLAMAKNWADSNTQGYEEYDFAQGTKPGDSAVYLKRAYIDWLTNKTEDYTNIITIGRQPSTDGPSANQRRKEVRQGTYNALAFDGAVDGLVNSTITKYGTVRLAYGKNAQLHSMDPMSANPYIGVNTDVKDTNVTGLFYEKDIPTKLGNVWLQYGHTVASDLIADNGTTAANIGDVTLDTLSIEANDIAGQGINAFGHFGRSTVESNGTLVDYGPTIGNLGLLTMTMCQDPTDPATCSTDVSEKTGDAIWFGVSKDFNPTLRATVEYNKGDQYWFNFTQGSRASILNKLATRGDALEVSVAKTFESGVTLRAGVLDINYDYAGSGSHLGTPMSIEDLEAMGMAGTTVESVKQTYLSFMVRF